MSDRSPFGEAVLAIVDGDEEKLRALLQTLPALVPERAAEPAPVAPASTERVASHGDGSPGVTPG